MDQQDHAAMTPSLHEERLGHDREAWQDAVTRILGEVPAQAVGDDAERMACALRSVSLLLRRLSPKIPSEQSAAA